MKTPAASDAQDFAPLAIANSVRRDLRSKSVRGAIYIAIAGGGEMVLKLIAAFILARLLNPEHFGLTGMVTALTNIAAQFSQLGLSTVTVQKRDINHKQVTNLFWINVSLGAGLWALFCALSPAIATFYRDPRLVPITIALSTCFIWAGSMVQHEALLSRHMKQAQSAMVRFGAGFISTCLAVVLALAGFGYWALVWQELARSFLFAAGVWLCCPWRPGLPSRNEDIRGLLRFGADLTATQVFCAVISNVDRLLVGRLFGASSLGMYRQAQQLIMTPIDQLSGPIASVMQPGLSILQDDPARYRRYYEKSVRLIGFASMPLAAMWAIYAEEFTMIVLGAKWLDAVPVLRIFAMAALIRPVLGTSGTVLLTCGKSRRLLVLTLISQVTLLIFVIAGLQWGPNGVALAYVLTPTLLLLPNLYYSFVQTPVGIETFFRAIRTPAIATATMAAGLLFFRGTGSGKWTAVSLGTGCALGGVLFVVCCFAIPGGRIECQTILADVFASSPWRRGRRDTTAN